MGTVITTPSRTPLVAASILSADFAAMGDDVRHVLHAGADLLHLDVMDGHFVPNLTMGPDLCRAMRRVLPEAVLDVHLMITDPGAFLAPFADAGADHITFHVETADAPTIRRLAGTVHERGLTCGLALNPATPASAVMPFLDVVDVVLVMSVHPGFSGQAFMPEVLEKVRAIAPLLRPAQRLEMDGGLKPSNAAAVRRAGCDMLVVASALFGRPRDERSDVIRALREC